MTNLKSNIDNTRLDILLTQTLNLSREKVKTLIRNKKIKVNQKIITKPSFVLHPKDNVKILSKALNSSSSLSPTKKVNSLIYNKIKIIKQTPNYFVINKPAGLLTHPKQSFKEPSLATFLIQKYPELKKIGEHPLRPGIVHRLDQDTSGLIIIPKTNEFFQLLKSQFKQKKVEKKYIALVHGKLKNQKGEINYPIARSPKNINKFIAVKAEPERKKYTQIKEAITYYKTIESNNEFSLLEVYPETGRTHQIRVHLTSIGHPIIGDPIYTPKNLRKIKFTRLYLHAKQISFTDLKGKKQEYISPTPKEFENFK